MGSLIFDSRSSSGSRLTAVNFCSPSLSSLQHDHCFEGTAPLLLTGMASFVQVHARGVLSRDPQRADWAEKMATPSGYSQKPLILSKNWANHLKIAYFTKRGNKPRFGKSTYFCTQKYGLIRAKYGLCTGQILGTYPVRTLSLLGTYSKGFPKNNKKQDKL